MFVVVVVVANVVIFLSVEWLMLMALYLPDGDKNAEREISFDVIEVLLVKWCAVVFAQKPQRIAPMKLRVNRITMYHRHMQTYLTFQLL